MVSITDEKVCHEHGKVSYRVKIQQFRDKMRNWVPGRPVIMKPFSAMDCVLMLKVFPSGFGPAHKGHVSLYLENQTKEEVHIKGYIQLGKTIEYFDQTMHYKESVGYSKFFQHPGGFIGDEEDDEDENLAVTCHVSEIWKEAEFKSPYLINKETYNEVKQLRSTMAQLDSRQTRISQFVGQSAPQTKLMCVKIEDVGQKLNSQEAKMSHVTDTVEELKNVISGLKAKIAEGKDLNNAEDVTRVENSMNIDVESAAVMQSTFENKPKRNIEVIKNMLHKLDSNMKVHSISYSEFLPSIAKDFSILGKQIEDLDSKLDDFDLDLKAGVKEIFKSFEDTITTKLSDIETQIKEEGTTEDQKSANKDSESCELYLETFKKDIRDKFFKVENFISRLMQSNKDQVTLSFDNGFKQQKENFENIVAEIKVLKRMIENSALNNENKVNNNIPRPECQGCNMLFDASSKIAQCNLGHLMCWDCKERPDNLRCPTCLQPINGRAYGMENFLSVLLK